MEPVPDNALADADAMLVDARARTLALVADLDDDALRAPPRMAIVNPMLWEIGHVAWFQESWTCRRDGAGSLLDRADGLYDSIAIPDSIRWDLALPDRAGTLWYVESALERARERLALGRSDPTDWFHQRFCVAHEDMHAEALAYMRQTLGWAAPDLTRRAALPATPSATRATPVLREDAEVPATRWVLGADSGFLFDNERPAHAVDVAPFRIARTAVTQGEFREFVDAGGYRRDGLWSDAGLAWRKSARKEHPRHWRREDGAWQRREFDRFVALEDDLPVIHVSFYEAEAYCRFASRRLPTEAEWEVAALFDPQSGARRRHPWGDDDVTHERVHADGIARSAASVHGYPSGDSAVGCRQMLGNVWEWTADWFLPHPGFLPDPYLQYSMPAFGFTRVLKGGSFLTRHRMLRAAYRNFFPPTRDDVPAGFRTCAVDAD